MWESLIGGILGAMANSGDNTQTAVNSVPPEFSGLANQYATRAAQIGDLPYNPYPYSRVADFNPFQYMGFDMGANQALGSFLPQQSQQALSGLIQGQQGPSTWNPYIGAQSTPGSNQYAGQNPYLESVIGGTLGDMANQFNMNVAPTEVSNALRSGSFGNQNIATRADQNRYDLAKAMGNVSSQMRMGDYGMQQQLAESDINRRLGAQQNDLSRSAGLYQSMLGLDQQNFLNQQRNQLSALGLAPTIESLGYQPSQYLQGIGSTMQQQGQNVLDSWYNQFQEAQNWPFKTYQAMGAPFGQNIGSVQTTSMPGSPIAGALGGAMLGNTLFKGVGSNPNTYGNLGSGSMQGFNDPSFSGMGWGQGMGYW